jgi:hypothetical protein
MKTTVLHEQGNVAKRIAGVQRELRPVSRRRASGAQIISSSTRTLCRHALRHPSFICRATRPRAALSVPGVTNVRDLHHTHLNTQRETKGISNIKARKDDQTLLRCEHQGQTRDFARSLRVRALRHRLRAARYKRDDPRADVSGDMVVIAGHRKPEKKPAGRNAGFASPKGVRYAEVRDVLHVQV